MKPLSLTISAMILACTTLAHAGPQSEQLAKKLFLEGNRKLRHGDYAGAVTQYRAAYAQMSNPKILHNLAVTLALLGRNVEAADTYETYLRDPARNPHRVAAVEKRLRELEAKIGRLTVEINERDARVYVDGKQLSGSGALSRRVEPGHHVISAGKAGYRGSRIDVTIGAGETRVVSFQLVRAVEALPTTTAAPPVHRTTSTTMSSRTAIEPDDDSGSSATLARRAPARAPGRLGVYLRSDIDGNSLGRGAVLTAAVAYRATERLQLGIGGIVAASPGVYAGGTVALTSGRVRPVLLAGVPIQLAEQVLVGVHAAAGVQLGLGRQLGLLMTAGVEHFFRAPADFQRTIFVPSVGLTWRL